MINQLIAQSIGICYSYAKNRMLGIICRRCVMHANSFLRCLYMPIPLVTNNRHLSCLYRRSLCSYLSSAKLVGKTYSKQSITWTLPNKNCDTHIRCCSTSSVEKAEDYYSLNYIYVKTSDERWYEVPDGVQFDVGFVDSMPDAKSDSKVPVILGLPSSLGSHQDLMKVLLVFVKYGCRVIIPNMPSTKLCMCRSRSETTVFMNSPDEKAEFIIDFLAELNIDKVHMLVTDSDSVYTGVYLCSQYSHVKSFAMINPTGLQYTRFMQPLILATNVNRMWEETFYMQPVIWCILLIVKMFTRKRYLSVNELLLFCKTIKALNFGEVDIVSEVRNLQMLSLPCMAVYRENCEELDQKSSEEMLELLGIQESSVTVYNQQNELVKKGTRDGQNWGVLYAGDVGDIKETKTKQIRTHLLNFYISTSATRK